MHTKGTTSKRVKLNPSDSGADSVVYDQLLNQPLIWPKERSESKRNSRVFGRNTTLNFGAQAVTAVVAIVGLPFIVRNLQADAYGLISLAISALALSSLLDLGLGRATTNAVADCLSAGDRNALKSVVWTSLSLQFLAGIAGGLILFLCASPLVSNVLKISPSLRGDAVYEFRLIALAIPFVIGTAALRGVLEGALRFDLVNLVRIPLNASSYLIPLGGALLHISVPGIVALMVSMRAMGLVTYLILCWSVLPELARKPVFDSRTVRRLMSYGGWVSISNLILPIYMQLDRYIIAATAGVGALTFYSVPFEILTGLSILPISLLSSLFPLISGLRGSERESSLEAVYARPLKYLALALGPIVLALIIFSHDVLYVWQGAAFADKSALVLQILLIGSLINAFAMVPGTWLCGISRPDVVAKVLLIQVPVYIPLAYVLISRYGIVGAALAFTPRVALEAALYFVFSFKLHQTPFRSFAAARFGSIAIWLFLFAAVLWPLGRLSEGAGMHMLYAVLCICAFWNWAWVRFLDDIDHAFLRGCFSVLTKPASLTKTA